MRKPHRNVRQHQQHTRLEAPCDAFIRGTLMACSLVLASLVLAHAPAHAETPAGCVEDSWVDEVAHFVAVETRYDVPEVCVRFAGQEQLDALVPSATSGTASSETVAAVYVPATREILLAHELDPATPLARSYLAHELVHAQQFMRHAHEHALCLGVLEGEAYNMQALYLHSSDSKSREDAVLLQVIGMFQSACGYSE
jgi:hypothetical protein